MTDNQNIIPEDIQKILINVIIKSGGVNNIDIKDLNRNFSRETTLFLSNNDLLKYFSKYMLSKCMPLDMLYLIGDRIDWIEVFKRKDITKHFIKDNENIIDITLMPYELLPPYDKLYNIIENKRSLNYTTEFIINIIKRKYKFEEVIEIIKLISTKKKSLKELDYSYTIDLFETYFKNYKDNYHPNNKILFKKFMETLNKLLIIQNIVYYIIFDILTNYIKITPEDLDYLLKYNVLKYYNGDKFISSDLRDIFYKHRNKICAIDLSPFNIKNYELHQIEELIDLYYSSKDININLSIKKTDLWNVVSYNNNILGLNTPYTFLKKNIKNINWLNFMKNILFNYEDRQEYLLEQFIKDFKDIIYDKFIGKMFDIYSIFITGYRKNASNTYIFPEIFIKYFCQNGMLSKNQISYILGIQKVSIELIEELINFNFIDTLGWFNISAFQILNPDFIKKYESCIDWNALKYNPTWLLYDDIQKNSLFHKLPEIYDNNGDIIFGTVLDKEKLLIKNNITHYTRDNDYFIFDILNINYYPNTSYVKYNNMLEKKGNKNINWYLMDINSIENINIKKYKDAVFSHNKDIMECSNGSYTVFNKGHHKLNNPHKPMIVLEIFNNYSNNTIYNEGGFYKVKVHYKNITISNNIVPPSFRYCGYSQQTFIYLPLNENIEIIQMKKNTF
jgi:hypothetical protein